MRCLMCGKETANLSDHNICANCEETYYNRMTMESYDLHQRSDNNTSKNTKRPWAPVSRQGKWALIVAIYTFGMFIASIYILSSEVREFLGTYLNPLIILSIAVVVPAMLTILLASHARSRSNDDSILTAVSRIAGIILASTPILLWILILIVLLMGGFHISLHF
jgi:hypothetical protein